MRRVAVVVGAVLLVAVAALARIPVGGISRAHAAALALRQASAQSAAPLPQ